MRLMVIDGLMNIKQITSTHEEFKKTLKEAERIVAAWPAWKRKTRATSYPRPKVG